MFPWQGCCEEDPLMLVSLPSLTASPHGATSTHDFHS